MNFITPPINKYKKKSTMINLKQEVKTKYKTDNNFGAKMRTALRKKNKGENNIYILWDGSILTEKKNGALTLKKENKNYLVIRKGREKAELILQKKNRRVNTILRGQAITENNNYYDSKESEIDLKDKQNEKYKKDFLKSLGIGSYEINNEAKAKPMFNNNNFRYSNTPKAHPILEKDGNNLSFKTTSNFDLKNGII